LPTFPNAPEYCRATPTDIFPNFGKPVSSITQVRSGSCSVTSSVTTEVVARPPANAPGFGIVAINDDRRFLPYYLNYHLSRHVGDEVLPISGTCPYYEKAGVKFDFKPCEISALARCWIRNMYHEEIKEIARTTAVNELPPVLQSFFSLPVFAPK
jgi:hypothetical protein